jgi:ABC-type transport system substrate-binding protein
MADRGCRTAGPFNRWCINPDGCPGLAYVRNQGNMPGTLRIVAAAGPNHIDTVSAYYTADYMLEHAYTRQLVSYPTVPYSSTSDAGWTKSNTPMADMATEVPTTANGGITNGGKTYTFHIKQGLDWNSSPPRQVTASDFVREFKAFFNPVSPVGNPGYYESTIFTAIQASRHHQSVAGRKLTQCRHPGWA